MTGQQKERDLVNALEDEGWTCMRAGGSGAGGDRPLPDVHAASPEKDRIAIELKYGEPPLYFTEEEMSELGVFCLAFESRPMAGARFKGDTTFYIVPFSHLPTSEGESYVLDPESATKYAEREVEE